MNTQPAVPFGRHGLALAATLFSGLTLGFPGPARGQLIEGTVRDREGGAPVASAEVVLTDTLDAAVATALSGSDGTFRIKARGQGTFRIRVESLGYATSVSDTFTLGPLEELRVDLFVSPEPIGLPPLQVRSRRRPLIENGMLQGFVDRRERGWGRFITRDQIAERSASTVVDVLRTVPGVRVEKHPIRLGWYLIRMSRAAPSLKTLTDPCLIQRYSAACLRAKEDKERAAQEYVTGGCPVVFYVDNVKVRSADYVTEILNMLSPIEIEAIEVYRGASEMPGEFSGPDARCGVVVIWTRRSTP